MHVLSDDYDVYYKYYGLIINSTLASYKFVFLFNRFTKMHFKRENDIILEENGFLYSFSSFFYRQYTDEIICSLIENKSCGYSAVKHDSQLEVINHKEDSFLLPNYQHINYILRIDEEFTSDILNTLNLRQPDFDLSVIELNQLKTNELERIRI